MFILFYIYLYNITIDILRINIYIENVQIV